MSDVTHTELVARAERWLRGTMRCRVVLAEFAFLGPEIPDAIGWTSRYSYLVECKATRADFFHDAKKRVRQFPEYGMGDYRVFMTPPGLVTIDEVPAGWGLVEARPTQVRFKKLWGTHQKANTRMERCMLVKALACEEGEG